MTFFLSFLQSPKKHPIPAYDFWQYYIKNGITEAGHKWTECPTIDWALGLVPKSKESQLQWMEETWQKTVNWLKEHPADLFLSYLYPAQIDITAVNEIKKMGIPCINFFCDNVREFKKIPIEFSVFDLNWVPEYKAINFYKGAGYPSVNLPMPMWIEPKLRVVRPETNEQITFIGSKDIQRQLFFEDVVKQNAGIPLAIYGNGWGESTKNQQPSSVYSIDKKLLYQFDFIKNNGMISYLRKLLQRNAEASDILQSKTFGAISFEAYMQLTAESMVTVGINRYPSFRFPLDKPDSYSRLRDIEAPMLGACYLTEWTEGIEELYEVGKEIEVFKNAGDFIEKINKLAADAPKRKSLKLNGQKKALHDHSVSRSLIKLLNNLMH